MWIQTGDDTFVLVTKVVVDDSGETVWLHLAGDPDGRRYVQLHGPDAVAVASHVQSEAVNATTRRAAA